MDTVNKYLGKAYKLGDKVYRGEKITIQDVEAFKELEKIVKNEERNRSRNKRIH